MSNSYTYVTGGAGMIGSALVRHLIEDHGEQVVVLDDFSRGNAEFVHPKAILKGCDLAHGVPRETLDAYPPSSIYHLSCRIGGVNYMLSHQLISHRNAAIDWNVFEAALATGASLLYCSTACIYPTTMQTEGRLARDGVLTLAEDDATRDGAQPESIYGWAKLIGELALAEHVKQFPGADFHIVRMFNAYGPHEIPSQSTGHVIPALIHKVLTGEPPIEVWGTGRALRSFLHVDDAANGIVTVMRRGRRGIPYNLGTPEVIAIGDLAKLIIEACTGDTAKDHHVRYDPSKPQGVFGRAPVTDRAKSELGWEPRVNLFDGVRETVDWCRRWLVDHGEWDGTVSSKWARRS
jgi:nucleoside-diphosphate-sugar epimerase